MSRTISLTPRFSDGSFRLGSAEITSRVDVQCSGSQVFVQLAGVFDQAAQQHLREALEWLFDTGISDVRIELADPQPAPDAKRAVDRDAALSLVGVGGDHDA